jgi:hypothetical protein
LVELAAITLSEAFSDGDLPYRVGLIERNNIGERWRQTIAEERVKLTKAAQRDDKIT